MIYLNSYTSFPVVVVQNSVEYPPIPGMTTDSTSITTASYGNGTYVVSASSSYPSQFNSPWLAFNKNVTANEYAGWTTATASYNSAGTYVAGTYQTSVSGLGNLQGEHITLQLPSAITLTSYSLQSIFVTSGTNFNDTPQSWYIVGSNNGTTWFPIDSQTSQPFTAYSQVRSYSFTNTTTYTYIRLIVSSLQSGGAYARIGELRLFGF
jgi:hypothetical protein